MAKHKAEKEGNKISKTTIVLYAVVILISAAFLSIMSSGQGSGGGCCDCSNSCCCCEGCDNQNCFSGCCNTPKGTVPNPYGGEPQSIRDYYCTTGTMPPYPPEGECDPSLGQLKDCPLQSGVCEGAKEACIKTGQWPTVGAYQGCTATNYRLAAAGTTGDSGSYEPGDESTCDNLDNDCDGEKDEGCDEDDDDYCTNDMECSGSKYDCEDNECTDCDDSNPAVNPDAPELCDGIDNNCNHKIDEGCECTPIGKEEACPKQLGVCAGSKRVCRSCEDTGMSCEDGQVSGWDNGCDIAGIEGYRSSETGSFYCADGLDNDCDGYADCGDVAGADTAGPDPGCIPFCPPPTAP